MKEVNAIDMEIFLGLLLAKVLCEIFLVLRHCHWEFNLLHPSRHYLFKVNN